MPALQIWFQIGFLKLGAVRSKHYLNFLKFFHSLAFGCDACGPVTLVYGRNF